MKWDLTTVSSLYLVALAISHDIHSLRDLTKGHVPMLRKIQNEAKRIVKERWNLDPGVLRFYIHYQPSYCKYRGTVARAPSPYSQTIFHSPSRPFPRSHRKCELRWNHWEYSRASSSPRQCHISRESTSSKLNVLVLKFW